jgi:hypothetical protein
MRCEKALIVFESQVFQVIIAQINLSITPLMK